MTNNSLDPKFWEAINVTPVVINPDDPESMVEGGKEIARRINEFLEEEGIIPPKNPTDNPPPQ